MRDLKHLIYFESLLENADNDLVKQAQAEGKLAIGYTCYHMPEPLLNLPGCFSVRLRAPRTGSLDIATYYMSNYTCEYARALVERGMEGGYQFLDALAGVDACSMMNRAMEHFEILQMNDKPNFFVTHCDIPYKITDYTLEAYVKQMRLRVLNVMHETYGVDVCDEALRKAVEERIVLRRAGHARLRELRGRGGKILVPDEADRLRIAGKLLRQPGLRVFLHHDFAPLGMVNVFLL